MTFQFSSLLVAGGLAVLAGAFFLLQRLRVRQRSVTVETTLFWKDAVEDARARVLVQRFRHPWVYAFLLLIASLLWLGFAGLERGGDAKGRQVVLLDGSAAMTASGRFDQAVNETVDYAKTLPTSNRWVVLCGSRPETVLRPGEDIELLRKRLEGVTPQACPSSIERTISQMSATNTKVEICVAGGSVVSNELIESLPDNLKVVRLAELTGDDASNQGITALGFAPAKSGRWDYVDVLVQVVQSGIQVAPSIEVEGQSWAGSPEARSAANNSSTNYYYRDLPARGQELRASIKGEDSNLLDDVALLLIPDRRPITVQVGSGLPPALLLAIESDPGISIVSDRAQVVVRRSGDAIGQDLPALEIGSEETLEDGILAIHPAAEDPTDVLMSLHHDLGLSEIDASDLAREGGAAVTMGASPGPRRSLKVWNSLFTDEFNFIKSRAFPVFVGTGLRWLASFVPSPESAAVGAEMVFDGGIVRDDQGHVFDTLGDSFRPARSGRYSASIGVDFVASYLSDASRVPFEDEAQLSAASSASAGSSLVSIILMVAMILLVSEWILYRLGRIP